MKEPENIRQVFGLAPDFMGFIFYPRSPRFVDAPERICLADFPENVIRTGVFVNEPEDSIRETVKVYGLSAVQLHGKEPAALCRSLRNEGLIVLKVFSVSDAEDFTYTEDYEGMADYFLFDTKTKKYGGSGEKFDWRILQAYHGNTPFFLSGGIGPEDVEEILEIRHPRLSGIDLNSRFEISPGLKDHRLLANFIEKIK